jgi:hypothetical protein
MLALANRGGLDPNLEPLGAPFRSVVVLSSFVDRWRWRTWPGEPHSRDNVLEGAVCRSLCTFVRARAIRPRIR